MPKTSTPVSECGSFQPIPGPSGVGKTKTSPVDINIQNEGKKLRKTEITYRVRKCQTCDQPFQPNSPRGHHCAVYSQVLADSSQNIADNDSLIAEMGNVYEDSFRMSIRYHYSKT